MKNLLVGLGITVLFAGIYMILVPNNLIKGTLDRTKTLSATDSNPDAEPSLDTIQSLKNECLQDTKKWSEQYNNLPATDDLIWKVNNKYRLCLAGKGLTPEDLFSYPSQNSQGATYIIDSNNNVDTSFIDELNQKKSQRCQEDINEYNICMNEKNAQLAEYNTCLTEVSNPNHWRYGLTCSQPYKSCFKPSCAY